MTQFHFLRPEWFLALIPAAIVMWLAWRAAATGRGRDWAGVIDAHLLRYLTVSGASARPSRGLLSALAAGLAASVVALAGPAWEKLPVPTAQGGEPVAVVLSLAQTMNGTDLVPSRLARAGHKLRDILDRAAGDDVGLVIFSDRPFVAAPLTPDGNVIREMLPELSASLMPVLGNRLDRAIAEAEQLLASAGATRGRILVMADDMGDDPEASLAAARMARKAGYEVSVLGVGTEEGAALQTADGRAIRLGGKDAPVAKLDRGALAGLADAGGGGYSEITPTSEDLDRLLPKAELSATGGKASDIKADRWLDRGYLLVLIPVLLMPLAFRRGVLFALALVLGGLGGLGVPPRAEAAGWDSLWATPDQQGARDFQAGDYAAAATAFEAPGWKGAALYRGGDYAGAAAAYGSGFNAGNALAKAGKLEEALAAYDAHLAVRPDDADAQFNRDLVAKLLDEQKKQDQDQDQDEQKDQDQDEQKNQQKNQPQNGGSSGDQQQDKGSQDQQKDQQQNTGSQDQQQDQQQKGGNDQAQGGAEGQQGGSPQDQQSASGDQQSRDQAQQKPGEKNGPDQAQDPEKAGQDQPQSAKPDQTQTQTQPGDQTQDTRAQGSQPTDQKAEAPEAEETALGQSEADDGDEGALSRMIDRLLEGNGSPDEDGDEEAAVVAETGTPLNQSAEQQLRAVPDDPAGLLRARIRQHYAQLRANGQ